MEIKNEQEQTKVIVKDIEMEFGSMVLFMIKWAIAAIPAAIILFLGATIVVTFFTTIIV
jgi:CHASE2 domain-containing sensor protein